MTAPLRFDSRAKYAFVVACLVLVSSALGFRWAVKSLDIYLQKLPVELREPFATIPSKLGRWRQVGNDRLLGAEMLEELGTRQYLDRNYAIDGDPSKGMLNVHLAYYTGMIDAVPHVPDRCLLAGGFNQKTQPENYPLFIDRSAWQTDPEYVNLRAQEPYPIVTHKHDFTLQDVTVRLPLGDLELRTVEFEHDRDLSIQVFGGYFFIANGHATPSPLGVRALAFDLRERYAYYCKVQFMYIARDGSPEQFVTLASDLLKDLLPEVMKRLPDWAEVERRGR